MTDAGWLAAPGEKAKAPRPKFAVMHLRPSVARPSYAQPGDRVTVRFPDGEVETFLLVDGFRNHEDERDVLSPLGWALWEAEVGDTPSCDAPAGRYTVTVVSVEKAQS